MLLPLAPLRAYLSSQAVSQRTTSYVAWDADAFRRPDNPGLGGFDILYRELRPVVELDPLA